MFKEREILLCTNAGRYYTADKKKRSYRKTDLTDKPVYVIYNNNQRWGFSGFWIEPAGKGRVALELYHISNLGPTDGSPVEINGPIHYYDKNYDSKKHTEIFRVYLTKNGIEMFDGNIIKPTCTIFNEISSYMYQHRKDLEKDGIQPSFYFWGNSSSVQDLRNNTWDSRGKGGYFCQETIQILKEAGFPEDVYIRQNKTAKLNSFDILDRFYLKKQTFTNQSKQTTKDLELFTEGKIADVVKDTLVIQTPKTKILYSFKKGVKCLSLTKDNTWMPLRTRAIYFTPEEQDEIVNVASTMPELSHFATFIKESQNQLFSYDDDVYYPDATPFLAFLKAIQSPEQRRFIENLAKFDGKSLFATNFRGKTRFFIDDNMLLYVDLSQWDLAHQLRCNKWQLKLLKETCPEQNFQQKYSRTRDVLRSFYGDRYVYGEERDTDPSYKRPLSQFKDNEFDWLVKFLAKPSRSYYGYNTSYGGTNPFGLQRNYFANDEEFLKITHKFWDKVGDGDRSLSLYNDYLEMRHRFLGTNLINEELYPLLPKDLREIQRLHDELMILQDKQKMALKQAEIQKYKQHTTELAEKLSYKDKTFSIELCRDPFDLKYEGLKLHHCVGGYVDRVIREETYIIFLRYIDRPNEPFVTINLNAQKTDIIQIHGVDNWWLGNWPEAIPVVMKWLKKNKINCKDEILLSTAKGYCSGNAPWVEKPEI